MAKNMKDKLMEPMGSGGAIPKKIKAPTSKMPKPVKKGKGKKGKI